MERQEWLARYRAAILAKRPEMPLPVLDDLCGIPAHEALSIEYPDNPEKAVSDDRDFDEPWPAIVPDFR